MLGIEVGIVTVRHVYRLHALDAVEGEVEEQKVVGFRAEQKPAVAELLQQVGTENELPGLPGIERLVHDAERLPVRNVIVERVEQADPLQIGHTVEVDDGLAVAAADGKLVLKTAHHIRHLGKLLKALQLAKHVDGLLHHVVVVLRHRHVHDGIVIDAIAVVFVVVHLNGGIVAQLVGAHHLYVALDGSYRDTLAYALHVVERLAAGIYQVFKRPPAVAVAQAVVYRLVAY